MTSDHSPSTRSRLDDKLARIVAGAATRTDFVIADAKDADMANAITGGGLVRDALGRPGSVWKTRAEYQEAMRAVHATGHVDILLMSASNAEALTAEGLFSGGSVTPAVRLNDTTDIWLPRGGRFETIASRPFRSAAPSRVRPFCNLGLYSITFVNDLDRDHAALEAYRVFRAEAEAVGMRHFLEVFTPNVDCGLAPGDVPDFVNDMIMRTLSGLTRAERPLFLKMPFFGARPMRELARFDPSVPVGILGGGRGTARDTFELLRQAADAGAWVALFGRKINLAESPVDLLRLMRAVVEAALTPREAVAAYHDALGQRGLAPDRRLADDQAVTETVLQE